MNQYRSLAYKYDELTQDVPYDKWVEYYQKMFRKFKLSPKIVLDFGCGTGSVACRMAERGYDVIGVDASPEMLSIASEKSYNMQNRPLFLCQKMQKLDLYGTIDAAVSSLDSLNYITKQADFVKAIERVSLFLNPKGLFLFDVKSEKGLRDLHEKVIIKENDGVFCVWESMFSEKSKNCTHAVEIFSERQDGSWERDSETHCEHAYPLDFITETLVSAGFSKINCYVPFKFSKLTGSEDRWFFAAQKP